MAALHDGSACCSFKRSRNDALSDESDGKSYCGTCWQSWVMASCKANALKTRAILPGSLGQSPVLTMFYEDDETVGFLEGAVLRNYSGKECLYLLSRERGLVFDPCRTEQGLLRRVGVIDSSGNVKLEPEMNDLSRSPCSPKYPFAPNPADHCETPLVAYKDILLVLDFLAASLGKSRESLRIYDPYYCDGAVKKNLAALGFTSVHNECVDFYKIIESGTIPDYDCLITNPPYNGDDGFDHVEALLSFVTSQKRPQPWLILQPNYVYVKPYWNELTSRIRPLPYFLTPPQPREYVYITPPGLRSVRSAARKTAPFVTFWHAWLGEHLTVAFYRWWVEIGAVLCSRLQLACCEYFLPDHFKDSSDKTRRRPKSRKRRRE
jgi:hypothetical protein